MTSAYSPPTAAHTHTHTILLAWLAQCHALGLRQQWAGWAGQELLLLWLPFLGSLSQPRKTVSLSCTLDRRREGERERERGRGGRDTKRENEGEKGETKIERQRQGERRRGLQFTRASHASNTHIIQICSHLCSSIFFFSCPPPPFFSCPSAEL